MSGVGSGIELCSVVPRRLKIDGKVYAPEEELLELRAVLTEIVKGWDEIAPNTVISPLMNKARKVLKEGKP